MPVCGPRSGNWVAKSAGLPSGMPEPSKAACMPNHHLKINSCMLRANYWRGKVPTHTRAHAHTCRHLPPAVAASAAALAPPVDSPPGPQRLDATARPGFSRAPTSSKARKGLVDKTYSTGLEGAVGTHASRWVHGVASSCWERPVCRRRPLASEPMRCTSSHRCRWRRRQGSKH